MNRFVASQRRLIVQTTAIMIVVSIPLLIRGHLPALDAILHRLMPWMVAGVWLTIGASGFRFGRYADEYVRRQLVNVLAITAFISMLAGSFYITMRVPLGFPMASLFQGVMAMMLILLVVSTSLGVRDAFLLMKSPDGDADQRERRVAGILLAGSLLATGGMIYGVANLIARQPFSLTIFMGSALAFLGIGAIKAFRRRGK